MVVALFFFISGAVAYPSWVRNPGWADYFKKRLPGLFIPWYLICLLALLVYGVQHGQLPQWSAEHLYRWLTMAPRQANMPIPLGQVWFLNTLLWLSLAAPCCFWLYHHQRRWFLALFLLHAWVIALSQALIAQLTALGLLPGGLSKLLVIPMMLLLSALMALPFSALCERINGWFSARIQRQVR